MSRGPQPDVVEATKARILVTGSEGVRYLQTQTRVMVPLFRALVDQALNLTPIGPGPAHRARIATAVLPARRPRHFPRQTRIANAKTRPSLAASHGRSPTDSSIRAMKRFAAMGSRSALLYASAILRVTRGSVGRSSKS